MTKTDIKKSFHRLSVTDRIDLVDDLLLSIASDQAKIPVTESQKEMIDDCLVEIERHPRRGMNANEFRKTLKEIKRSVSTRGKRKSA